MDYTSRRQFLSLSSAGALAAIATGTPSATASQKMTKAEWME
jgi:anaerobic selenocysteine-containing dehydrogenase